MGEQPGEIEPADVDGQDAQPGPVLDELLPAVALLENILGEGITDDEEVARFAVLVQAVRTQGTRFGEVALRFGPAVFGLAEGPDPGEIALERLDEEKTGGDTHESQGKDGDQAGGVAVWRHQNW